MWAQKKVRDLEAIIPLKQPSLPTSVSADASNPTAWKDAGGRLMNSRPRMCCILGHCGLQSETLWNKTEERGEEKEEVGVVAQGEQSTTKENRSPGRMAQADILEIRRLRQGDHCKFKAPLIYIESLKIKAK